MKPLKSTVMCALTFEKWSVADGYGRAGCFRPAHKSCDRTGGQQARGERSGGRNADPAILSPKMRAKELASRFLASKVVN